MQEIEYVDMGTVAEEDKPFMIVDKDTGRVYDMRNPEHLDRLSEPVMEHMSQTLPSLDQSNISEASRPS
jgi:hypothetical protein